MTHVNTLYLTTIVAPSALLLLLLLWLYNLFLFIKIFYIYIPYVES